jgi:hypothetical protein
MDHESEQTLFEFAIRWMLIGTLFFALSPFFGSAGKKLLWLIGGIILSIALVLFMMPFGYVFIAYPYIGSGFAFIVGLLFHIYSLHFKPKGKKIMQVIGWLLLVVAMTLWIGGCYIEQENIGILNSSGN